MGLARGNKKTLCLLLLTLVAAMAAALFLFLPIRAVNLTTGDAGWTSTGCFAQGSVHPSTSFDKQISGHEREGVTLWGSYCGNDASMGELRSPVFKAPAVLELFVADYVGQPDLKLFLEREDNHVRVALPLRQEPGEIWLKLRWSLDANTRGQQVRLVAIDRAIGWGGWLGVSNPRSLSLLNLCRQQLKSASRTVAVYLAQWALFLLPGFAAASLLTAKRRPPIAPIYLVIIVVIIGATFGYLSFWAFFFSKGLGKFLTFAVYAVSVGVIVLPSVSLRAAIKATAKLIAEPVCYATVAGLCYISFYFLFTDPFTPGIGYASDRFFLEMLPGDNVIPLIFADRIYRREPVRPFCCGDWLSSDRPPLQTGIVLLERPLPILLNTELNYQLLSSALQCLWICGVWCLLKSLGTPSLRIRQVIGFLIFSGFLFYNSLYTWPKLLAAACILFLLSILFELVRANRPLTDFETLLAAVCLGLSLMAHPGSTFSLPTFGILFLRFRRLFTLRQVAVALLIVVGFYAPWFAYQKFVDPPGDRLLKMHFGGIVPLDSRTAWEGIRDSYHSHTWSELARYKWSNLTMLAGHKFFDSYGLTDFKGGQIDHSATEESRIAQRHFMWNAVGLANFGWLAGLFLLMKRPRTQLAIPFSGWLMAAAMVNLIFWSLITFGPDETQTAHSSYSDILLLSIGLLSFVLTLPRIFYLLLFAWQLFNFWVVWVWSQPARILQPSLFQAPMFVMGVALAAGVLWWTLRRGNTQAEND
jgi:hypothetical protein